MGIKKRGAYLMKQHFKASATNVAFLRGLGLQRAAGLLFAARQRPSRIRTYRA